MTSTNLTENKSNLKCMDDEVTEESLLNNLYKLEYYLIDLEFISFINHTEYDDYQSKYYECKRDMLFKENEI